MIQAELDIRPDLIGLITAEQAWHYRILPKSAGSSTYEFYVSEEHFNAQVQEELELILGREVVVEVISDELLDHTLSRFYKKQATDSRISNLNYTGSQDVFLQNLIGEAKLLKSSDIHIETYEMSCRIRIRIDGELVERYKIDKKDYPSIINKIKIMSNLDISEKRLPQDGRIFFSDGSTKFDIRVSVLPTLHGEKVVMRLLNNDATDIDIYKLGFSETDLANYLDGIKRPNGIFLISGPTGSGKTTTLYATLKLLNKTSRNLTTIEDPIEYTLEGVNQVQLKESIGFTFPEALRNFLRQDPNIIMVGEIRDTDTANMAIRTSLTGHLVLSTIHTNSAWGTVARLVDMGIPPFLVADTLNTTVAQRLIRVLCPACKRKEAFHAELLPRKFTTTRKLEYHYVPTGCPACYHTGYSGRRAVYEVIPIDFELAECIKTTNYRVAEHLKERGISTLAENAFELFAQGITSMDEIYPLLYNF